jgi:hypothetical protein
MIFFCNTKNYNSNDCLNNRRFWKWKAVYPSWRSLSRTLILCINSCPLHWDSSWPSFCIPFSSIFLQSSKLYNTPLTLVQEIFPVLCLEGNGLKVHTTFYFSHDLLKIWSKKVCTLSHWKFIQISHKGI